MTDKEKLSKIRAKVKERLDYNQQHENDYAGTNYFWQKKEDEEILHIIDSMQEEPKTKFKVGDIIRYKTNPNDIETVDMVNNEGRYYILDIKGECTIVPFSCESLWELV